MFKFQYQNGEKRKSEKTFPVLQNGAIQGLQVGAKRLQIRGGISNRGKEISNRGKTDFKLG